MKKIDWEALGEIEDGNYGWRAALASSAEVFELSSVYVAGEGDNPEAFIIGEAPGAHEEVQQRPFVGPAGIAMRDLMAIAGLYAHIPKDGKPKVINNAHGLENCWLTNVVKFRPPKNRKPTPIEIKAARPWLRREWVAVGKPRLIIPVGGIALEAVTGRKMSILKVAGKCHEMAGRHGKQLVMWPMIHPSFGLRIPAVRSLIEQDWERLAEWRKSNVKRKY